MIIVKLWGGLGNQMFQYALGRHIAYLNNTDLKLDVSLLHDRSPRPHFTYRNFDLDIFNVSAQLASSEDIKHFKIATNKYSKIIKISKQKFFGIEVNKSYNYIIETQFNYNAEILNAVDNTYIDGFWQTEKYFSKIEDIIRKEFTFREEPTPIIIDLENQIQNTDSVCIHVRRGDFVQNKRVLKFHGIMEPEYYYRALDILKKNLSNPHLFIFSDDNEWCRSNLKFDIPSIIIEDEWKGNKFMYSLYLMSKCKDFIIPNSSFGWWGAWLSENPKKNIIAPQKWLLTKTRNYSDVVPDTWIKI